MNYPQYNNNSFDLYQIFYNPDWYFLKFSLTTSGDFTPEDMTHSRNPKKTVMNEYCVSPQKKASRDTHSIPALHKLIIPLMQISLYLRLMNIGINLS